MNELKDDVDSLFELTKSIRDYLLKLQKTSISIQMDLKLKDLDALKQQLLDLDKDNLQTIGANKMPETNSKSKNEKQIGYKVFIYGEPKVETINPHSGKNAGQEVDVLTVRAFHRNYIAKEDGTFEQKEPTWMNLKKFGADAKQLGALLKSGMKLKIDGILVNKPFKDKDGKEHQNLEFNADSISLDLSQKAIKGIVFDNTKNKSEEQTQNKSQGKQEPSLE